MINEEFYEQIYDEYFNKTYNFIKSGLSDDIEKEIDMLDKTLETLYTSQGDDWIGRGELALIKSNATIASIEVVKSELVEKIKRSTAI